nr:reverse transcriptase domain-containing protein [Tanacetum cinerariifolium]
LNKVLEVGRGAVYKGGNEEVSWGTRIPKRHNRRRSKQIVEPELRTIEETPVATIVDTRTMSELLQVPTEGYGDANVIPVILVENFELKVELLSLKFYEMFSEAWDRFKDLLRKCPHHVGGNLLNRTPQDALTIIVNKSKVRILRNKPIVSKVNTTTSSPSLSLDITALTEIVKELVLMNKATQQVTVKVIEETCVICGGPHPYYECLATDGNTFDACAAVGTYNQGSNRYRPQGDPNYRVSNQMGPPDFPPLNAPNNQNYSQNRYNQNQGNYQAPNNQGFNQQRGQNFNQGNNNYQSSNYEALNNQAQAGPSNELSNYMKSNDATLRAMQTQMSNMKMELRNEFKSLIETKTNKLENQNNQIMNMLTNLTMQRKSPSGLRSLPSNTIANPRGDLKAITTQSGITYEGPLIPSPFSSLPKEVEREPKSLLSNKEKLFELANTLLTENCSGVLLKKLPEKLGDPKRFLIPCDFYGLELYMDLADLGARLNLIPLYLWKKLSLPGLTPTRMTLELATRSIAYPAGIAEDVFVQVGKFTFPADFVVIDYDVDHCVPLILGTPFLRTACSQVDVHGEELILRDDDENLIFHADSTLKHPHKHENESINMINFIDITCEVHFEEVLKIKKSNHPSSGRTTPLSDYLPSITPFETSDSLLEEFSDELALLDPFPMGNKDDNFDPEADLRKIEYFPNQDLSTESDIEIIDPIFKRFTHEPSLIYSPPSGDDDDDLFDLKSDNEEWKKLLYGEFYKDIESEKGKNKNSKMKLLVVEAQIVESNDLHR